MIMMWHTVLNITGKKFVVVCLIKVNYVKKHAVRTTPSSTLTGD